MTYTFVFHVPIGEKASDFHAFCREHGILHRQPMCPEEAGAWRDLRNSFEDDASDYDVDGAMDVEGDTAAMMLRMKWNDYIAKPWTAQQLEDREKALDARLSDMTAEAILRVKKSIIKDKHRSL